LVKDRTNVNNDIPFLLSCLGNSELVYYIGAHSIRLFRLRINVL